VEVFMRCLLIFLVAVLLSSGMSAGEPTKPYEDWHPKEAEEVLFESPWSCCCTWRAPYVPGSGDTEGERLEVYVQLFSSHPIRQALAVLAAAGDAGRLERWRDFATRDFDQEIVVSWIARSKPQGSSVLTDLMNQLRRMSLADLKQSTFLVTSSGRKVEILDYIPPTPDGSGAKFIFPRRLPDGSPLVIAADEELFFQTRPLTLDLGPRFASVNCKAMVEIAPTRDHVREMRRNAGEEFRVTASFALKKLVFLGGTDF
jgi:hypothetical protein